jgi:cytidylate kinase
MKKSKIIIAIDGPSASGKGTVARGLAEYFNFSHLDTGLLYRAVGRKTFEQDPDFTSELTAIRVAQNFDASWLDNPILRNDESSAMASKVAVIQGVRQALLDFQRNFAMFPPLDGAVLDGRDIATVICPKAPIKLFVTASAEIRAKRRFDELTQKRGIITDYETVLSDLNMRDARDMGRTQAPLKMSHDSLLLDTSKMSISDAIAQAIQVTQTALASDNQMFVCV